MSEEDNHQRRSHNTVIDKKVIQTKGASKEINHAFNPVSAFGERVILEKQNEQKRLNNLKDIDRLIEYHEKDSELKIEIENAKDQRIGKAPSADRLERIEEINRERIALRRKTKDSIVAHPFNEVDLRKKSDRLNQLSIMLDARKKQLTEYEESNKNTKIEEDKEALKQRAKDLNIINNISEAEWKNLPVKELERRVEQERSKVFKNNKNNKNNNNNNNNSTIAVSQLQKFNGISYKVLNYDPSGTIQLTINANDWNRTKSNSDRTDSLKFITNTDSRINNTGQLRHVLDQQIHSSDKGILTFTIDPKQFHGNNYTDGVKRR